MIHGINERIAGAFKERERSMPTYLRPAVALVLLVFGTLIARVGLKDLIAKGYGTLTWFFLVIYVVPVLTWGVWKIRQRTREAS
jgi:uncharacterized membrane protein YkvI